MRKRGACVKTSDRRRPTAAHRSRRQSDAIQGAFIELSGTRLWYRDSGGDAVPVVFLHAATGSSEVWEHQIPAFTAAGFRFIAYDRRGFGRTETDPASPP